MVVSWVMVESQPERNHLAQLCRGFLVHTDRDPLRAEAFLTAFLKELAWAEVPLESAGASPTTYDRAPHRRRPASPGFHHLNPELPPDTHVGSESARP